jgi:hypothetical protein
MYRQGVEGFHNIAEMLRLNGRALGLVWFALAGWVIGRMRKRVLPEPELRITAVTPKQQLSGD